MDQNYNQSISPISSTGDNSSSLGLYFNAFARRSETGQTQAQPQAGAPDVQESEPYRVTLSEEALRKAGLLKEDDKTAGAPKSGAEAKKAAAEEPNSPEAREVETLKRTDREVRAHEQAHVSAGGSLVRGAASFGYAAGPDGKLYAVSGEVEIDSSPVQDDPAATIRKMRQVVRAALAPAEPSGQDRAVASAASQAEMSALAAVAQQVVDKLQGKKASATGSASATRAAAGTGGASLASPAEFVNKHINIQA